MIGTHSHLPDFDEVTICIAKSKIKEQAYNSFETNRTAISNV